MNELFTPKQKKQMWDHLSVEYTLQLFDSEVFDLWIAATTTCRAEIIRLERLIKLKAEQKRIAQIEKGERL